MSDAATDAAELATESRSLDEAVTVLSGVGPSVASKLAKLELRTVEDVLWHLPRDVIDLTQLTPFDAIVEGETATLRGTLADVDGRQTARGGALVSALVDAGVGFVRAVWFQQPWRRQQLSQEMAQGKVVVLSGKPKLKGGGWEFSHPVVQFFAAEDFGPDASPETPKDKATIAADSASETNEAKQQGGGVLLKYALTEGIGMPLMRRITRDAAARYADLAADVLPQPFCESNDLVGLPAALRGLHRPAAMTEYEAGRRRVLFDDLFEFQLGMALRRRAWSKEAEAPAIAVTAKIDARIRRLFPFQPTAGQEQAIANLRRDIARSHPMHRLLQADVGAGKTVVAVYAMLAAIAAGYQAALMAPTELLAQQHRATIDGYLAGSRVRRAALTGSLSPTERRDVQRRLVDGEIDLVVGTQALIQESVDFDRLGLVVIDEQHKFGVAQRAAFSREGAAPHVLVMTATPIPRSLCLTQFGDLDVTAISDRPPGRQPVTTARVMTTPQRRKMWAFVREQLDEGRQLYVVAPRIEGDGEQAGAEELADRMRRHFGRESVGLVHGRMDREQRQSMMDGFRVGDVPVLVSTTVIEVGVDVPNASLMIINDAGQFGLSQLHQLRGRIGRGSYRGYCFLLSDPKTPDAAERLLAMEETDDGFAIAERDFELRGAGDVLGTRQSGQMPLRVADLRRDQHLLLEARRVAFELVDSAAVDEPEFATLKRRVLDRFGDLMELPRSG